MNTSKWQGWLDSCLFVPSSKLPHLSPDVHSRFNRIWQAFTQALFSSNEPRVWQKVDRQGQTIAWFVYDPTIARSICFGSELEVRLWLEQRYYR